MSITKEAELTGMRKVSEAVAHTLREMKNHARPGMTTKELDEFGAGILQGFGANSAPFMTYRFPGWTCISVNHEFCHGIPSDKRILREGDLINIDVSAELDGFWSDNGNSFVLGEDIHQHQKFILLRVYSQNYHHCKVPTWVSRRDRNAGSSPRDPAETESEVSGIIIDESAEGRETGKTLRQP